MRETAAEKGRQGRGAGTAAKESRQLVVEVMNRRSVVVSAGGDGGDDAVHMQSPVLYCSRHREVAHEQTATPCGFHQRSGSDFIVLKHATTWC